MARIPLKRPWTHKPDQGYPTLIDTADVWGAWAFTDPNVFTVRDISANGRDLSITENALTNWVATEQGRAIGFGNSPTSYATVNPGHKLVRFTHELLVKINSAVRQPLMGVAEYPGSGTQDRGLYVNTSLQFEGQIYDGAGKKVTGTTIAEAGKTYLLHLVSDGQTLKLYVDGIEEGSIAAGDAYTGYASPELIFGYGYDGASTSASSDNSTIWASVHDRALSAAEISNRAANIWGVLAPRTGAFKYSATASTTYTKSVLLDSILERQDILRTVSIEAALQREKIERISSIDSSLQSSAIIMASLDAQIQNVINIASAIDAILRSGNSAEASLDSILQIKKNLSVSADSILTSSGNYVSSTIDAALLKQSILSVLSLDAELKKQGLLTASSIDSVLQAKSLSIAANTDAALRKLRTIISAIDAIMVTGGTSIISSLDAMLSATKSLVSNIDSALGKERTASVSINGILALTGLLTSAMDAVLTGATTISVALNSLIKKTGITIAVAMDAILSGGLTMGCPTATVSLYVSADGSIIFYPSA